MAAAQVPEPMTIAEIVVLALKLSISLLVFGLGLKAELSDLLHLLRHPGQLVRSLLAMNVLMPLVAVGIAMLLPVSHAVRVVLVIAALAPVPPILPRKEMKAGGRESYAISLLFTAACFALISIPLGLELLERVFGVPLHMPLGTVLQILITSVVGPLILGVVVRMFLKSTAERVADAISAAALVVLLLAAVGIMVGLRGAIWHELNMVAIGAFSLFAIGGLAIGHLLGGPDPSDRTVLALSTATRHPGLTFAIAAANFSEKPSFMAALLIYIIAAAVISGVYLTARRRRGAAQARSVTS